jgi:DNA-directed RNA polymerase subunit L
MRDVEYRDLIDELNMFVSGKNEASSSFEDELHGIYKLLAEMTSSESTIEAVRYVIPATGFHAVQALTMI